MTAALAAQSVRLANRGAEPFDGWIRTTVDSAPTLDAGVVDRDRFVVGRRIGLDTWSIDVRAALRAGEERTVDLGAASRWRFALGSLPVDPARHFGALFPQANGVSLPLVEIDREGAGASMHFRGRLPGLWCVDVWATWRPDDPGLVVAEVVACASNPSVPDVVTGTNAIAVGWGDGLVHVAGAGWFAPIVPAGQAFGSGQARGVPITIVWPRNLGPDREWRAALAAVQRSVFGVGLRTLLPDGNPVLPRDFNAEAWTVARYAESLRRLHTFEPALVGPSRVSRDTGAQEDQAFVGAEALAPGGVSAEQVRYLAALKLLARPCHHLQLDGAIVDPVSASPRLLYWDGGPHYSESVSPNRLGKPRAPSLEETSGWAGPDAEHPFHCTSVAAARLTGSRALQWDLSHDAMVYLGTCTSTPGWGNSDLFAARAIGWEAINVAYHWRYLEDRALAARVRDRWLERAATMPTFRAGWIDMQREQWDVRRDDARLGPGDWWVPWQQAVGAYGLDLAGAEFGLPGIRAIALRAARVVLRDAWEQRDGRWVCRAQQSVAPPWPAGDESFAYFGMAMSVAVVLRHEPQDERARAIWTQLVATPERGASWLAPGVQ